MKIGKPRTVLDGAGLFLLPAHRRGGRGEVRTKWPYKWPYNAAPQTDWSGVPLRFPCYR